MLAPWELPPRDHQGLGAAGPRTPQGRNNLVGGKNNLVGHGLSSRHNPTTLSNVFVGFAGIAGKTQFKKSSFSRMPIALGWFV